MREFCLAAKLIEWFGVLKTRIREEAKGTKGAELAVEVKQRVNHVSIHLMTTQLSNCIPVTVTLSLSQAISSVGLSLTLAAVLPRLSSSLDLLFSLSSLSSSHLHSIKASSAPFYALNMLGMLSFRNLQ